LSDELDAIFKSAAVNKLVNISKTKEIVFRRPNPNMAVVHPALSRVGQLTEAKLLAFVMSHNLRFDAQINGTVPR
jgi:hypothetical protein